MQQERIPLRYLRLNASSACLDFRDRAAMMGGSPVACHVFPKETLCVAMQGGMLEQM